LEVHRNSDEECGRKMFDEDLLYAVTKGTLTQPMAGMIRWFIVETVGGWMMAVL